MLGYLSLSGRRMSARTMLRALERIASAAPHPNFEADLRFLQSKDLDLSVRIGALLAFDALLVTAGINPLAASPGSPLSLDAARQPGEVAAITIGMAILAVSSWLCVRAILYGEEFDTTGIEHDPTALAERLLAAYVVSIDAQSRLIARAGQLTVVGGLLTGFACIWIMVGKMVPGSL